MAARDMRSYFKVLGKKKKTNEETNFPEIVATTEYITPAEISSINNELKETSEPRKQYNATKIPLRIKEEVSTCASSHGTNAAKIRFNQKYPRYTFIRTSINNWKRKIANKAH